MEEKPIDNTIDILEPEEVSQELITASPAVPKKKYKKALSPVVSNRNLLAFLDEFLINGGNATQAALKVWPNSNRQTAAQKGHELLKKHQSFAQIYLENKGASYGKLLDIAIDKAYQSKTPEWWDRLAKIGGYHDFMDKKGSGPGVVNIIQAQKQLMNEYVEGEVEEDE